MCVCVLYPVIYLHFPHAHVTNKAFVGSAGSYCSLWKIWTRA